MTTAPNLTAPLTPSHRTLLLKHSRSTVLLAVLPSTPLLSIKRDLVAALASRGISTFPGTTGLPLPHDDPAALEFGVLVDRKDASRGWRLLREDEQGGSSSSTAANSTTSKAGRGGGKRSETAAATATGTVNTAGLVDGTWLAYRLSSSSRRRQQQQQQQQQRRRRHGEEEIETEEEPEIDGELDDPGWNVVIATFEEADAAAAAREADEGEEDEEDNINNIPIPAISTIR